MSDEEIIAKAEADGWFECGTSSIWQWRHPSMKDDDPDLSTEDLLKLKPQTPKPPRRP